MNNRKTIEYYNINSKTFYSNTVNIELNELYENFLQYIPNQSKILDLGCGSGRDSLYFLNNSYDVTSLDASEEMVRLSSKLTKRKTLFMNIEDINFQNQFHGIWACASLLHINKYLTKSVYNILENALKKEGILYASYRYGKGTSNLEGRYYNNYDEKSFCKMLKGVKNFDLITHWISKDLRPERPDESWFNILLRSN